MDILYVAVLFLHFVSWALILGGWLATIRTPGLYAGIPHAALTALVTGVLLVGIAEMQDLTVNHMKIGVKLLITVIIVVLAFVAKKKADQASPPLINTIGALTVLNIALALFWTGGKHFI
ncbi:hypothetical protein [Timonella sp. A28]|uniref:hypothetical protein n=1 Tax=Timonella sp. A28 TaxID=3442640 RepID=UPI003EB695C0